MTLPVVVGCPQCHCISSFEAEFFLTRLCLQCAECQFEIEFSYKGLAENPLAEIDHAFMGADL